VVVRIDGHLGRAGGRGAAPAERQHGPGLRTERCGPRGHERTARSRGKCLG
jgi:hypothetical protein